MFTGETLRMGQKVCIMVKYFGVPGAAFSMALRSARLHAAFDPGTPGWKKKADGSLELDASGNPVWVNEAGKEVNPSEVITRLNSEAAGNRTRAENAERERDTLRATVETFKDIDPAKARDALEKLGKIDAKQLIDAGKVDEVRAEVNKAWEPKLAEATKRGDDALAELSGLRMTTAFQGSKFVTEKLTIPADMVMAQFGKSFTWEGGKFVAKDANGGTIYSGKQPGTVADFDEALETLVNNYPHRASIIKGGNGQGSGNGGQGGNDQGGKKKLTMAEFTKLTPAEQGVHAADVRAGKAELVD